MSNQKLATLVQMLKNFINDKDRSLLYVNKIEDFLSSNFDEEDDPEILDALEVPLALYHPGGLDLLYGEDGLTDIFKNFLAEFDTCR